LDCGGIPTQVPPWEYRQASRESVKGLEPFVGKSTIKDSQ